MLVDPTDNTQEVLDTSHHSISPPRIFLFISSEAVANYGDCRLDAD